MGLAKGEREKWDLDQMLTELKFGLYQIKNLIIIGFLILFSNLFPLSFSLTTADLEYRCLIPECETAESAKWQFMPSWIRAAIPFRDSEPWKCKRYKPLENATFNSGDKCSVNFSSYEEENCGEWVFATDEITIVNEFGILCENRRWQLSLIGTINNAGQFLGIPLFGIISDWVGRKPVVIICSVMSATFGICRGLSTNYFMFVIFEFLDSFFAGAIYSIAFILGIELVNSKMRPWVITIIQLFYPFGAIFMGCIGWYFQNWRKLLILSYGPGLFFISYFWILPESVRWLYMKGRHNEARTILRKIATSNNVEMFGNIIEEQITSLECEPNKEGKEFLWRSIIKALQTKHILFRLMNCSWCWFAVNLVYYGLSINSVELVGNKYMNFILMCLVEVPAIALAGIMLNSVRRRTSQSGAFLLCGLTCIVFEFIPSDMIVLKIIFYLISKFLISISFAIIYVYSAEIFPTELRLSLCGVASTVGRIGSMIAPQMILLKFLLGKHAPAILFGVVSIFSGCLATLFPETLNKKLQDTIEQTELEDEL